MARAEVLHWNPSDYLSDYKTKALPLEMHGAYCLLLWNMWTSSDEQCSFPLDYRMLGVIWQCPVEEAERITDALTSGEHAVLRVKETRNGAVIHSKRLQKQKAEADAAHAKRVNAGKKSGAARRGNATNNARTMLEHETNSRSACRVSRSAYLVARAASAFDEAAHAAVDEIAQTCADAYPVGRFRAQGVEAVRTLLLSSADVDPDDLIAACTAGPADGKQTLRFFIEDGEWGRRIPRKRRTCSNPDCLGGHVLNDDGDAVPCPECAS